MKRILFLVLAMSLAGQLMAQDKQEECPYEKYGRIGEHHELLKEFVGVWDVTSKYWPAPDKAPMSTRGISKVTLILGGRFAAEEYKSHTEAFPFKGMGVFGYDNVKQKYTSAWIDSMSTAIMLSFGTFDKKNQVLTMEAHFTDPVTGKKMTYKMVTKRESKDKHTSEFFMVDATGKAFKNMELIYMRKKK